MHSPESLIFRNYAKFTNLAFVNPGGIWRTRRLINKLKYIKIRAQVTNTTRNTRRIAAGRRSLAVVSAIGHHQALGKSAGSISRQRSPCCSIWRYATYCRTCSMPRHLRTRDPLLRSRWWTKQRNHLNKIRKGLLLLIRFAVLTARYWNEIRLSSFLNTSCCPSYKVAKQDNGFAIVVMTFGLVLLVPIQGRATRAHANGVPWFRFAHACTPLVEAY